MRSPDITPPPKPLAVQSCIIPDDMPQNEFEWADWMIANNKIGMGDRKFYPFQEDANGKITSYTT